MSSLILYPINIESAPNWVIRNSFAKHFSPFEEYDWVNIAKTHTLPKAQQNFIEILKQKRPDYCFMQLQNPINMDVATIREMAKYTKIINWCGDVRTTKEWYDWFISIGKEIFLTLFSNETDPQILRDAGVNADYLQVGFDNVWYNRKAIVSSPDIVYCANDYGNFQLSRYRADVVRTLRNEFGDRFGIFGSGWEKWDIVTTPIANELEASLYNSCKIAISVSNFAFERYYSDRLLRIMACGAFPLSHNFSGVEKDFKPGVDIGVFSDLDDLVKKCHYYLSNPEQRTTIASNAYAKAHRDCTWDVRCVELIKLINKHDNAKEIILV
jgi:hypothetical protein